MLQSFAISRYDRMIGKIKRAISVIIAKIKKVFRLAVTSASPRCKRKAMKLPMPAQLSGACSRLPGNRTEILLGELCDFDRLSCFLLRTKSPAVGLAVDVRRGVVRRDTATNADPWPVLRNCGSRCFRRRIQGQVYACSQFRQGIWID